MLKKRIEKEIKKPIGVLKSDINRDEKEVKRDKKISVKEMKEKKILIVIEKGKIFTFRDKEIDEYIDSLPEDYNVNYVLDNDDTIVINKDYKDIAPMVRYLLGNVYESLEMRETKKNRVFGIVFLFITIVIIFIAGFIYNRGIYGEFENIKNILKNDEVSENEILKEKEKILIDDLGSESDIINDIGNIENIKIDDNDKGSGIY